ncbi:hypothetical protein [Pseudooceanicola aestuarii]|uniref:hypothetical protein n=1 Tax=Pseudooceanicola aestuarii TaxID=2697319 RepID=UPI0013CFC653|nr:hypothetical protein [Pseudooceanicola aestuarii]
MTEEHQPRPDEEEAEFAEESASLWRITLAPVAWAAHFVICYGLVAMSCAKGWPITEVRQGLGLFSAAVLLLIAWIGWRALRQWDVRRTGDFVNRRGRAEDRHHFLGHAAFLLAVISFIGVVFVSLPLILIEGCQ